MVKFKEKLKNANEMHIKTQKKTRYLTIIVLCYQINSFLFILLHFLGRNSPREHFKNHGQTSVSTVIIFKGILVLA